MEKLPDIKTNYVKPGMEDVNVVSRDSETLSRYWAIPGMEGFNQRNGGLEKDFETGAISSDPLNHQKMVDTRQAKIDFISNYIPHFRIFTLEIEICSCV